jgi:transposase
MRTQLGYLAYRICDSHAHRPDDVVFATLWESRASVQEFIHSGVGGVNWDVVAALPWEVGVVIGAVVTYVDADYRSLLDMGRAVAPFVRQRRDPPAWTQRMTDAQWLLIGPILDPVGARLDRRGRPRVANRPIFDGVLGVVATGSYWREVVAGVSAATAWRRYTEWEQNGRWDQAWSILLPALDPQTRQQLVLDFLDCARAPARRPEKRVTNQQDEQE